MDIFNLFSLFGLLNNMQPEEPKRPSRIQQEIYELSDELDYYLGKFESFRWGK